MSIPVLAIVGAALLVLGGATVVYLEASGRASVVNAGIDRYTRVIDAELRFLMMHMTARRVVAIHLGVLAVFVLLTFLLRDWFFLFLVPPLAVAPLAVLRRRHEQRVLRIEIQLDTWLMLLSNALKAVPSIGEAINASAKLMRAPLSEELDIVLKELELGSPLDQAIETMSRRVNSPIVSGALATLLIARQTGGDLSQLLEQQAATLREMQRLEGVVRTKTAEGRSQAWVLGAIPFGLVAMIYKIDPNWMVPLTQSSLGHLIIGGAVGLWILAILIARKILAVDI